MNITKALELFTYTPTEALEISTSTSIDNINYIISINENNVFLRYTPGAPEFLQGFTSLESGKGYCLSSKSDSIPYEFYASTDDIPESVTLNQLYQIATYCGTGFNLLGITITSQPSNADLSGDTASFSVEATVVGGVSLTYQWQISTDDGANWNDINGETNATLNLSGLDSNDVGNQYRVIVGATGEDSVTSNAVSLTAPSVALSITQQPQNTTAVNGNATFTSLAEMNDGSAVTYQWEQGQLAGDGETWTQHSLSSRNWYGVVYGSDFFVAVGYGQSATSNDGSTWSTTAMPTSVAGSSTSWLSVDYDSASSKFVAVDASRYATSSDGANWQAYSLPAESLGNGDYVRWGRIAIGGGVYVAVSIYDSTNTAVTGANGTVWTKRTLPATALWKGVAYGDGKFVTVAYDSNIAATSTDGVTWTQRTLPTTAGWSSVTYGNGRFVAVANNSNIAATSADGVTWTQRALPASAYWSSVGYGNGTFVAVTDGSIAATSPDGITWTQRTLPTTASWYSVGYGNGRFVAVGSEPITAVSIDTPRFLPISGETSQNLSLTGLTAADDDKRYRVVVDSPSVEAVTSDAATLTVPVELTITSQPQNTTASGGEASFAVSATVNDGSALTYQWEEERLASDGATWVQRTLPASAYWRSVTYGNETFVAVTGTFSSIAATSTDGATWTQRTLPASANWCAVTYGNGTFVAVTENSNIAATSPDGITWTQRTLPASGQWYAVAYGNGTFVALDGYGSNAAATSTDGITWTQRTLPSSAQWRSVTYGSGTFVAVASGNTIAATSPDGITWTQRTLPASANWWRVTYGNGTFVAVTLNNGIAATSTDGITWTQRTLPASGQWYGVTYGNGTFVAVASGNTIAATSPDGITWTQRTLPASANWFSVIHGDGTFVAVAGGNIAATSTSSTLQFLPITGETASTLNLTGLTTADDGERYRVVVDSPSVEPVTSDVATLGVPVELAITSQPQNSTASGGEASFAVAATVNDGSALTYQWEEERLVNDGATWVQQAHAVSSPYNGWNSVTYGNGVFVAMTYSDTAVTSPDGATWTQWSLPESVYAHSVTYGDGVFVSVSWGITNIAATSPDGITWTQRTLPVSAEWRSVSYGNGKFVAVALNSNIAATSPDGITWTQRTLPTSASWQSVVYGDGKFVAVALNSNIAATSPDGITWTQRTLPASGKWSSVTYGNGTFVAVAFDSNIAATSPDGITWTQRTLPASAGWYSAAYGDGLFVAVTQVNSGGSNIAATSPDGITWTQRTLPVSADWRSVSYGNGTFVAVAHGSEVATSTSTLQFLPLSGETSATLNLTGLTTDDDGERYRVVVDSPSVEPVTSDVATLSVPVALSVTSQPQNTTAAGGEASFAVSATVSDGSALSYQWEEERLAGGGETWVQRTLPATASWSSVTYGNGIFVAVAYNNNIAATSTDGVTWTQRALPVAAGWYSVTYGDGTFVAATYDYSNIAATSTDGVTWTQRALPVAGFWRDVSYGNGTFVAVDGSNNSNIAATSPDGITWTQRTLPVAAGWYGVTYGDGTFVAVTYDNRNIAATSTDGINWTQRTLPATALWYSVTHGNGIFVAVAYNNNIAATSTDGVTWTQRALPVAAFWRDVSYGNGTFVAVAYNSNIAATSPDGITWAQRTLPTTTSWHGVSYGNGTFVAVAYNSTNIAATSESTLQFLPLSGETAATLNLTGLTTADDGERYRVVVDSPSVEPVTSDVATLSVGFTAIAGAAYAGGWNYFGQLGRGDFDNIEILDLIDGTSSTNRQEGGQLYTSGWNLYGQRGDS